MKKIQKLLVVALTLLLVFSLAACGSSSKESSGSASGEKDKSADGVQELTIKISHVVAENTPKHAGALAMKEYIEKESGGKIKVQVYPNSQLFGDKDEYQNLVANNAQFIIPDMSKLVGNDPGFNIPAMPFLFKDDAAANAFWDGEKGQEIFKRLEKDGVLGLAMWPNGAKHMTNNNIPIKKPEDLKGLKIRTQGGQLLEAIYEKLGAGSVSIPFAELYTALQQGTVDGEENTYSNIESKKFDEVQKYMTIMGHTRVDYALLTNIKFWNGLNDETKAIVQKGVEAGTKVARESAEKLNEEALQKLKDRGQTKINELSPEDIDVFKKTLEPVYQEWAKTIGEDIIKDAESRNK
jgi:C4-dicarboxylate-binding protein DctP